jgi:hypothetical protein
MQGEIMSLKEQLSGTLNKVAELVRTWPSEKTEDMKYLANYAYAQGWYLNEVFIFGLHNSITENENFDDAVTVLIDEDWDFYWKILADYQPTRASLFEEIKNVMKVVCMGHLFIYVSVKLMVCFSTNLELAYTEVALKLRKQSLVKRSMNLLIETL